MSRHRRDMARQEVEGAMVTDGSQFEDEFDEYNNDNNNNNNPGRPQLPPPPASTPPANNRRQQAGGTTAAATATASPPGGRGGRLPSRRRMSNSGGGGGPSNRSLGGAGGPGSPGGGGGTSAGTAGAPSSMAGDDATAAAANDEPARLFSILEEALPTTTEAGRALTIAEQQLKRDMAEHTWDLVRRWMWTHPHQEQRQAAAYIRGQADATPLHLMCKLHHPPDDIIAAMVEAAPEIVSWTDSHGWLPLHHACANGASPEVMRILIDAHPAGKLQQDNQSRTPLHFYATRHTRNSNDHPQFMTVNAELLSDTGAAELTDRGGMLPMHYACAYGTDPAVLQVLANVYPESLTAKEHKGRTPMHLAMVNAHRDDIPNVIKFLLDNEHGRATVNTRDQDGYLPLHLLALGLRGYKADDLSKRANVSECLSMYLDAEPDAAADFFTAIQDLPEWLQDTAVVSKHVRDVLNEKIVRRLPTSLLMMDGYMYLILIVCFGMATSNHIDIRFDPENHENTTQVQLIFLFIGATYFLMRELIQIASLISLGSFASYLGDPTNWLDVTVIFLVYYYAVLMTNDDLGLSDRTFRSGAAFTQGILYVDVIVYLKSTYVDFAVFVGGVLYVVRRLSAFLLAVGVILLAFAQMFYFIYLKTDLCEPGPAEGDPNYDPELDCRFPHCTFENSLLKVYVMMMGEIGDEKRYSVGEYSVVAQIFYVAYAFLVVILLSNVLIAIVTDSYEIIQNDRAAIVFWSNRLDFVAEMDAIIYGAQRRLGWCLGRKEKAGFGPGGPGGGPGMAGNADAPMHVQETATGPIPMSGDGYGGGDVGKTEYFRIGWQQVMLLFDANLYDEIDLFESWVYNFFRIFSILVVIPLWVCLGVVSAGWLWPPQIREALFVQKETKISRSELERKKLEKLMGIQNEMKVLKQDLMREMGNDRDEMVRMKTEVETVQSEVLTDLQQVRELLTSLLGE